MHYSLVFLVALVAHVTRSTFATNSESRIYRNDSCERPNQCVQSHQQLVCEDCIPHIVPDTVNELVLNSLHGYRLVAHGFCNVTWPNVTQLTISNDFDEPDAKYIMDYAFDCLNNIEQLKLSIWKLTELTENSFYGLPNVRSLDFIVCSHFGTPYLTTALTPKTVIPRLNKLVLYNTGSVLNDGIQLSQDFIDVLAQRNVTEINLSESFVHFENISFKRLCETLQLFNMSKVRISLITSKFPNVACESLRVVDFHALETSPAEWSPTYFKDKHVVFALDWFKLFSHAQVLYFNQIVRPDKTVYFHNSTFIVVNTLVTELHFCENKMPVVEGEVIFRPNHLKHLYLSNNAIERLGPNIFRHLIHLEKLDLSKNNLGHTKEEIFEVLFRNNLKLVSLSLAYNDLTSLPRAIFQFNTELKHLDLKGNRFTQIHFEISNLTSLLNIDLRSNRIEYLDTSSRRQLDTLYNNKQSLKSPFEGNASLNIDIRVNPLSCSCHFLDFVTWFVESPVFEDSKDLYRCEIDDQDISMNNHAVKRAEYDCDKHQRELRKVLFSTLLPCIILNIIMTASFILFKKYRKFQKFKRLRANIAKIHEDGFRYRFPVFLSYASTDSEFVEEYVYHQIQQNLKDLTGAERDLVAIGDRHFRLGRTIFSEIIRLLEDCAVIVIVLSENYCKSEYCRHEIEQARLMRKPVVMIMKEYVDEGKMNNVIKETYKHFTRATFRFEEDGFKLQQDWEHVCQSIIQLL